MDSNRARLHAQVGLSAEAGCRKTSFLETEISHAVKDYLYFLTFSRATEKTRLISVRKDIDGGSERSRI